MGMKHVGIHFKVNNTLYGGVTVASVYFGALIPWRICLRRVVLEQLKRGRIKDMYPEDECNTGVGTPGAALYSHNPIFSLAQAQAQAQAQAWAQFVNAKMQSLNPNPLASLHGKILNKNPKDAMAGKNEQK